MKKIQTILAPFAALVIALTLVACGAAGSTDAASTDAGATTEATGANGDGESGKKLDVKTSSLTINTEGMGQIAWAYEGEKVEFDEDFPFQSAVINDASGKKILMAAKADKGWKFAKWTKDGEDFSTEKQIEVNVDGTAAYVAVFESK